ncbi:tetratricopeptide repeat protein [bacterium]|nr:tetratricopeptide repeat protein [bacterium]
MKSTCISQGYFCGNFDYGRKFTPMINFRSKDIQILDAGKHMSDLSAALQEGLIGEDVKIEKVHVELNKQDNSRKQMDSVNKNLEKILKSEKLPDYVVLPFSMSVDILNLNDQYERVMGEKFTFTPENVNFNKDKMMNFLLKIKNHPNTYCDYIGYMDPIGQGIEKTYDVIQNINKLVEKGVKVYIPAGQPNDLSMKWAIGKDNLKPEFYYYLSKNKDVDGKITYLKNDIADKNWYKLNLLCFSDAENVGTLNYRGDKFIYSAYDTNVTQYKKGTYNLYPVRKWNGNIKGYSYYGRENTGLEDISLKNDKLKDFVGKDISSVLASDSEHTDFNLYNKKNEKKLYRVDRICKLYCTPKTELMGKYVDSSLTLFFDTNTAGEVIFNKTNIEGSQRPSIFGMWGSCFSAITAVIDDVKHNPKTNITEDVLDTYKYKATLPYESMGDAYFYNNNFKAAEDYYNKESKGLKEYILNNDLNGVRIYDKIGNTCRKQGKYYNAMKSYQCALGILCNASPEIHPKMLDLTEKVAYCAQKTYNDTEKKKYTEFSDLLRAHSFNAKMSIKNEKNRIRNIIGV